MKAQQVSTFTAVCRFADNRHLP